MPRPEATRAAEVVMIRWLEASSLVSLAQILKCSVSRVMVD